MVQVRVSERREPPTLERGVSPRAPGRCARGSRGGSFGPGGESPDHLGGGARATLTGCFTLLWW